MHHQHICEALGIQSLKGRRFLHPVLTTFIHALPKTYETVAAPAGTTIRLHITGEAEDHFYLIREDGGWSLYASTDNAPDTTITMSDDTAWRLFTKGLARNDAEKRIAL